MAHFAQLDENNVVINVVKVADYVIVDENGNESEQLGIDYLKSIIGGYKWVQTSYNNNIRHQYAAIGGVYHEDLDVFFPRKPYNSWIMDETVFDWVAPVSKPEEKPGFTIRWDDENVEWVYDELPPPPPPVELEADLSTETVTATVEESAP